MEQEQIKQIIEVLLLTSEKPLELAQIKAVLQDCPAQTIKAQIAKLQKEYLDTNRSFGISEIAGGYQITTDPKFAPWLKKLYQKARSDKLSHPALETLAIIAYRQPITRTEMEEIRGVNVDGVLKAFLDKSLIRITGRKDCPGRPFLYGTTKRFLELFGLHSLNDLPQLEEFGELAQAHQVKPQLMLAPDDSQTNQGETEDG